METKPGVKTTEFWTTLFVNVLGVAQLFSGGIDGNNKYVVVGLGIINGLYAASRGIAKQGIKPTE